MKKQKLKDEMFSFCFFVLLPLFFVFAVFATAERTDGAEVETTASQSIEVITYNVSADADLLEHIVNLSAEKEIPIHIIFAIIEKESNYNPAAVGDNGNSKGLMQIQERWHKARMDRLGVTNLFDPIQNVTVGVDYLAELLEKYNGNIHKALTAYNHGEKGANEKFFSKGKESSSYSQKVLEIAAKIEKETKTMSITDDPHKDFDNWDDEQHEKLKGRPICSECDHHIQDEKCYEFNGKLICPECLKDYHEKETDDYVEY